MRARVATRVAAVARVPASAARVRAKARAEQQRELELEQQQQLWLVWTPPPREPQNGGEPPWRMSPAAQASREPRHGGAGSSTGGALRSSEGEDAMSAQPLWWCRVGLGFI